MANSFFLFIQLKYAPTFVFNNNHKTAITSRNLLPKVSIRISWLVFFSLWLYILLNVNSFYRYQLLSSSSSLLSSSSTMLRFSINKQKKKVDDDDVNKKDWINFGEIIQLNKSIIKTNIYTRQTTSERDSSNQWMKKKKWNFFLFFSTSTSFNFFKYTIDCISDNLNQYDYQLIKISFWILIKITEKNVIFLIPSPTIPHLSFFAWMNVCHCQQ